MSFDLLAEVDRATRAAWQRAMQVSGAVTLYLYFRPGRIEFAEERPEGFELGSSERMPTNRELPSLIEWTHERARRLPCLPVSR